jgi:peptidoglycan hydrolase-like protein with peptidoglycan-binding domain
MIGDDVEQWQRQMNRRGWKIDVDRRHGDQSEKVCRQFQTEKGLTVDGIVGPHTWRATWTAPITP